MPDKLLYQQLSEQYVLKHKTAVCEILAAALGHPEQVHSVIKGYLNHSHAMLWGCFYQHELIALAGFYPLHPIPDQQAALELKHFAVASPFRKRGLGRSCLMGLIQRLQLYRLDIRCDADSVGFYRKLGFAVRPESPETDSFSRRFGAYYLNRSAVLKPDFRFPQVPLESVLLPELRHSIQILRLDLLHPLLSGNKWFKLWPSLLSAQARGKRAILSFGGAYSNHLYALAAAGKLLGFETHGVIRGERAETLNSHLRFCEAMGMHLEFVSRQYYRELREPEALAVFCKSYPECVCIPEGGGHTEGILGAALIQDYIPWQQAHTLAMACGTGASLAGLIRNQPAYQKILGVSVLKGDFHRQDIRNWLKLNDEKPAWAWEIETRFHCGGYAKKNSALASFIEAFEAYNKLPIEPVYTAKLLFALQEKIKQMELRGDILAVHSGGIYPQI